LNEDPSLDEGALSPELSFIFQQQGDLSTQLTAVEMNLGLL